MEQVIPFPFNNISLSVHDPFLIRSRSVHIFRPFWIRFYLFPCCAICFSAWQFMILIKERACTLLTGRMVFSDYTKKGYCSTKLKARTHTHITRTHAHITRTLNHTLRFRYAYFFAPVPSNSFVVLLYRSWLQHWIALNFSITHEQA